MSWYACVMRQPAHAPHTRHCSLFIAETWVAISAPTQPALRGMCLGPMWLFLGEKRVSGGPFLCASSWKTGVQSVCMCVFVCVCVW